MEHEFETVLSYWFGSGRDDASIIAERGELWFRKDPAVDADIRERFGCWVERAARGELERWGEHARGRLALIVLLDQFTRNIHRDTAEAFEHDQRALAHSLEGQSRRQDEELRAVERVFFYLPMEHAESLPVQDESVRRFEALRAAVGADLAEPFDSFLDYARQHRDVILRFGRFPHRNAALGRDSTPAEQDYLTQPDAGF
jgi:uncharacterized protein (DUF924 family)